LARLLAVLSRLLTEFCAGLLPILLAVLAGLAGLAGLAVLDSGTPCGLYSPGCWPNCSVGGYCCGGW